MSVLSRSGLLATLAAVGVILSPGYGAPIDSPMYKDPEVPASRVEVVYSGKAKPLWLKALDRPEADLKRQAAVAISLAHRHGVKGLESTVAPLRAALDQDKQHPSVRLAVARALISLDARSTAPNLLRRARADGGDLRDLVEPALARWNHKPARTLWLERLRDPAARPRDLILAIRCLAVVREERGADRLRKLLLSSRTPAPVRLQAARALGAVRGDGLEEDAKTLAALPRLPAGTRHGGVARLAAAALLSRHRSKDAIALLQRLTTDPEPAVGAVAVARLIEIDPKLALPALDHLLGSADANLRSFGVEVLFRTADTAVPADKHIRLLGDRLDDHHPDVRVKARRSLHELGTKKQFREQVIAAVTAMLAKQGWRGQEQSAILLTQFDHKASAGRLVQLLESSRPEVFVRAAWGLRKLAVRDSLPAVTRYVRLELARQKRNQHLPGRKGNRSDWIDHQLSQLNQFLGQQRYAPADPVLREFLPHLLSPLIEEARAAAVWALGKIHEGKTAPELVKAVTARLNDTMSLPAEDLRVREMSAVALGRLKAKEALPSLRKHALMGPTLSMNPVSNGCWWAINQITAEKTPLPETIRQERNVGFLIPQR